MQYKSVIRALRAASLVGTLMYALLSAAAAQRGPRQADMPVDAAKRQQVVESLIREMNQRYIFPDLARKVEQALRQHQKRGTYNTITSAEKLAATLTEQLQQETKDKHLNVHYSERPIPEQSKDQKPSAEEQWTIKKAEC